MDVFRALADSVRRDVLRQVASGPARVIDLADAHPISRPAISRHLRVLGDAGLVTAHPVGRERHYRLSPAGLDPVRELIVELTARSTRFTEQHLAGLDLEVRRTVREQATAPYTRSFRPAHDIEVHG